MVDKTEVNERRQRDFDDLQNEIAGRDVGRARRFLPQSSEAVEAKRKEEDEREAFTRLVEFLKSPQYRARYERATSVLATAERTVDRALVHLKQQIRLAEQALEDILARAARLPEGGAVFKDADGRVRRSDGTFVEEDLAATVLWRGDEPSFEAYQAQKDNLSAFRDQQNEVTRYQIEVLGDARNRLSDENAPPSLDELEQITRSVETQMPDIVTQQMPTDDLALNESAPISSLSLPNLGTKP